MQFFGIFAIAFWLIIIAYPQFLSYLIGFFFLFLGLNILIASRIFRRWSGESDRVWKIGNYEILKNKNRK